MNISRAIKDGLARLRKAEDGLATKSSDAQPEMIAIVRLRIRRGRRISADIRIRLFIAVFALCMVCIAGLVWLVTLIGELLSQFTGISIMQLEELLRQAPQQLLPASFAVPTDTWIRIQIFYELEGVLLLTFFIMAVIQVKAILQDIRWYRAFSRLPASALPPVYISEMMRISTPSSIEQIVVEEPSPTQVLDLVQQQHSLEIKQVIATYTLDRMRKDEEASVQAIIRLTKEVTMTLKQPDGKQETVTFREKGRHSGWPMLLSYLCQQPRGEWIHRDVLLTEVYGEAGETKSSLLAMHRDRINEYIEAVAEEAGISLPYDGDELSLLFEQSGKYWRLSPHCEVVRFEKLAALDEQLRAIEKGTTSAESLPIEDLIRRCDEVAIEYGKGYLAEHYGQGYGAGHQGNVGIWKWARAPYLKYRGMWLYILEAAARRLRQHGEQAGVSADEQVEIRRQVARCHGRSALATIGMMPVVERSAGELRQCVALCRDLMDYTAAVDMLQEYVDQLQQRPDFWKLPNDAQKIWDEATELLKQFYDHRKQQKALRRRGTHQPGEA